MSVLAYVGNYILSQVVCGNVMKFNKSNERAHSRFIPHSFFSFVWCHSYYLLSQCSMLKRMCKSMCQNSWVNCCLCVCAIYCGLLSPMKCLGCFPCLFLFFRFLVCKQPPHETRCLFSESCSVRHHYGSDLFILFFFARFPNSHHTRSSLFSESFFFFQ